MEGRKRAFALAALLLLTGCGSGQPVPKRAWEPPASVSPSAVSGSVADMPATLMSDSQAQETAERITAGLSLDEKVSQMVVGYMDIRDAVRFFPEATSKQERTDDRIPESQDSLMTVRETVNEVYAPRISSGTDKIMMSLRSYPKITAMITPAFMSYEIVTSLLRTEMGYEGIIYTPPLNDSRLRKRYPEDTDAYLAVEAVKAGCDILYQPKDVGRAAQALRIAVNTGNMSEERINSSVVRILKSKLKKGRKLGIKSEDN